MEIVVKGRGTDVADRFRSHVEDKLAKVTQLAPRTQRVDVELTLEKNPRLADQAERIEITLRDKGPVIRAEASAADRYAALDLATGKLLERLRRHHDRRKDRQRHANRALPAAPPLDVEQHEPQDGLAGDAPIAEHPAPSTSPGEAVETQLGDSPVIVRDKLHKAEPMTVDQALYEMEMVGHPFFLFVDSETRQPCVVYRRKGWSYGVLRLDSTC
ncbi:ribosome hibernation-promoting factor, HPF/YfiA family [Georgenia sp. Z1344]|uniref:ribosome hibernation-promoting factor, HPF/YfiA family n=1 Tax=Georgenia sp. Z1344 TaxID=3416706 RepID=UPI003CFB02DF